MDEGGGALVGKVDQSGPRKITASKSVRWPMGGGASVGVNRGESTQKREGKLTFNLIQSIFYLAVSYSQFNFKTRHNLIKSWRCFPLC